MTVDRNGAVHHEGTGRFTGRVNAPPEVRLKRDQAPQLAGSDIPELMLSGLTHVGSLNREEKPPRSHEGQGLSVSLHPEVWQRIAGLGGGTIHRFPHEGRFLDWHRLDQAQRDAILEWGVERGYLVQVEAYQVSWYDDELEDDMFALLTDPDEAEDEAEDRDGAVEQVEAWAATELFPDPTVKPGDLSADQVLATVWVTENAPDFDGVWWDDDLSEHQYSAPRGVIIPSKIDTWVSSLH